MPRNDSLHDGQTDARAFKLVGSMQPLEHSKEFVRLLHVKTYAIVANE